MTPSHSPQPPVLVAMPSVAIPRRRRLRAARTVELHADLHLRLAAQLVQVASRFESHITLIKGRKRVDGKSILGIMMLGASRGSRLRVMAMGRDAEPALMRLVHWFQAHRAHAHS